LNKKTSFKALETSFEVLESDFEAEFCIKKSAKNGDLADHPMAMGVAGEPPRGLGVAAPATPSQIRWPPHGHGVAVDGLVILVAVLILFFVLGVLFTF
jgi:hypothetical protein